MKETTRRRAIETQRGVRPPRCRFGLAVDGNHRFKTRCKLKPGHNGPHVGQHLPELPYQTVRWFAGDGREFITDRDKFYAWKSRT